MGALLPMAMGAAGAGLAGPAIASGLGSALGMSAITPAAAAAGATIPATAIAGIPISAIGGAVGGQLGSTLGQVLSGGGKNLPPDLPKLGASALPTGQAMGKQGAISVPVPPPIQSGTVRAIGSAMPTAVDPLEQLRKAFGL